MTEHKFTDEVLKALKCLLSNDYTCDSSYCDDCGDCLDKALQDAIDLICRQKAEIERFADIGKMYSEIKAEAVKEFAERLKTYYIDKTAGALIEYHIDQIAKEMLEGG